MSAYKSWQKHRDDKILQRGVFSYGLKGSADILGILFNGRFGRFFALEIKSGNAKQSKVQKSFQAMIEKFGGVYILARSPEEALSSVKHFI